MPPTSIRCPACGHALLTIDLPQIPHAQALTPTPRAQADAPLLLRIPEAARLLGVSRSTLYQLVARGEVRVVRIGQSRRMSRREVERLAGPVDV